MNVFLLSQARGVDKARFVLRHAGEWLLHGSCVVLIDADPVATAVDRSDQPVRECRPRLFGLVGLARAAMRREAPALARVLDDVVIDEPPCVDPLMGLALLAADVVLMPVYPPPVDCWASAEMLDAHPDVRIGRRQLAARLVLHRWRALRAVPGDITGPRTDHGPPMRASVINGCVVRADVARSDRLVFDVIEQGTGAREMAVFAAKVVRIAP